MVTETSFVVRIPELIYQEMVDHIVAGYPDEACGALGSKDGEVVKHYPTANAAEFPDDFSIISYADLLRIYNDVDEYDGDMIYYHSHPKSEAYPSTRDIEYAKFGYLFIIFSHQYYPKPPYVRVFSISTDKEIREGKVEIHS